MTASTIAETRPTSEAVARPHLGLAAQIVRAMHLDVEAYDEVAADPRYGWKVAALVVLGGAAIGSGFGWTGAAACSALAVATWLGISSAISLHGSIPFGVCLRAIGMAAWPLYLGAYTLVAGGYPTLFRATLGVALALSMASIVAAILRAAAYMGEGEARGEGEAG